MLTGCLHEREFHFHARDTPGDRSIINGGGRSGVTTDGEREKSIFPRKSASLTPRLIARTSVGGKSRARNAYAMEKVIPA